MDSQELRKLFLRFFEARGHTVVPSASLIPDDPSVLLTTAGMQQFKPYYTGDADPMRTFGSKNTVSAQKSFRTSDIDEVGDESHLTFFEMLGNFSFGGYGKKEAISLAHEFITKTAGLAISHVTIFGGCDFISQDEASKNIWKSLGVADIREQGINDVFWGPTGKSGPCGPTTEIYCKNKSGKDIEVWNIVFNEFFFGGSREELLSGKFVERLEKLKIAGIDTGMGLERLAMISQNTATIFETDLLAPLVTLLPHELNERKKRIIADHARGIVFLLADGVRPSNKEAGYVLRRLMRRVMGYEKIDGISSYAVDALARAVVHNYGDFYPELRKNEEIIQKEIKEERSRFYDMIGRGLAELQKLASVDAGNAFKLYESYGLPYEFIKEIAGEKSASLTRIAFDEEFKKHQDISRAGHEKKFGGHGLLLDTGELKAGSEAELAIVTRLHTATHLLNAALHKVLGAEVMQKGSDITAERTRFDFSFARKLTPEELQNIENLVNEAIKKDMPVTAKVYDLEEAKKSGATYMKEAKYPEQVKVYTVGHEKEIFSRELCGGPHVSRTGEIGSFKIVKEEASSAGVRRIRAVVK